MSNTDDGSTPPPADPDQDWWSEGVPNARQQARYAGQVARLKAGLEGDYADRSVKIDVFPPELGPERWAEAEFLYSTDTLLLRRREGDQEDVEAILGALEGRLQRNTPGNKEGRLPFGELPGLLEVIVLPEDLRTEDQRAGEGRLLSPVEDALEALPEDLRQLVVRDRVVHVTVAPKAASACPATDPVPAYVRPDPPIRVNDVATREVPVRVAVIDTGLRPVATLRSELDEHSWFQRVTGNAESGLATGEYRGHGMFAAGVLSAQAPAAQVVVYPLIFTSGGCLESDLAPRVRGVFETEPKPDIVSMSAGTTFERASDDAEGAQPLVTFEVLREQFEESDSLFICAAGNNSNSGPFHPASDGWPVAVGALDVGGSRAGYSNYGDWVDVYARGSDIVNAYPRGETNLASGNVTFSTGMAVWSGTSFATPLVAGLVAARMSWTQETPKQAWDALLRIAQSKSHHGMCVLEPGDADPGVEPPPA